MKPLTEKRLLAIREALNFRLAGEMDDAELMLIRLTHTGTRC